MRVHPVEMAVVHDAVEMERDGAQGGIVGVGKSVDNGMQRVAAHNVVFVFCLGVKVRKHVQKLSEFDRGF